MKNRDKKNVVIIGAGVGGLATALLLAKSGYSVTILEKNGCAGGRLNRVESCGFTFDSGPTFFSMSFVFEDFFRRCGVETPFKYKALNPLYSVHLSNPDKVFSINRDIGILAKEFEGIETNFEEKMQRYLKSCEDIFNGTFSRVVTKNFNSKNHYIKELMGINPKLFPTLLKSFWGNAAHYFKSTEAREVVSLVAFFLGSTPFKTSAVYSLLSYTEFVNDGYYNVNGGMYKIVEGFCKLLAESGVKFVYNCEINRVVSNSSGICSSVVSCDGREFSGDIFVVNADAALFRGRVLHRKDYSELKLSKMHWTMGTLTVYVGLKCRIDGFDVHNYFIGRDFYGYSNSVFSRRDYPSRPYFYVHNISMHNDNCIRDGCGAFILLVPVAHLGDKSNWDNCNEFVDGILKELGDKVGVDILSNIITKVIYTPKEWGDRFNLYKGSALGLAHNLTQVGGFRPRNFDEEYKNLYYVGASTTPGTGLPMCIISAELVCERIFNTGTSNN